MSRAPGMARPAGGKIDMVNGGIKRNIIRFAIPVFLGNLFQQLYNVTDSVVIGNFVGEEALAAVASSGSLIFLIVGFVNGIFVGAGVVIARYFGAGDRDGVEKAVHTTAAFGLVMGVVLTVVGILITPTLLRLMDTPANVLPNSILYFRIYFAGALGIVMYNTGSGIYQSVGDSRHPLYYLLLSSCVNVVLDLLFVAVFSWGIAGAGWATVIAQFTAASVSFFKLTRSKGPNRIKLRLLRFHKGYLGQIVRLGLPTGVQNSVIAFANVIVQSNINAFEAAAMAGCGSYAKIEGFAFLPITSFSVALTTFIGQNLGAGQFDRAKKGARFGILSGTILAECIGVLIFLFAPFFVRLFNDSPDVIAFGVEQARTEALFYCLLALSHCLAGVLRGAGKSKVPMFVMLISWCLIRITYITIAVRILPDIRVVFWAYPLTWFISSVAFLIYYKKADWLHSFAKRPPPSPKTPDEVKERITP